MPSMDSSLRLLIIMSFLCFGSVVMALAHSTAAAGSVLFIDSPSHHYLRTPPLSDETFSMSAMEVGAAVSVLLGLAPPSTLSTASSSKLNELLMPNPFDRPRHVLMLEVALAEDSEATVYPNDALFVNAIKSKVSSSSGSVQIELPDREEVAFFSLYGPESNSHFSIKDQEISDFAQRFNGSYTSNDLEELNGELIIPLPSGLKLNLHMSKKADREFATSLVSMINNIRKVMEMKQHYSRYDSNVVKLSAGYFDGVKALQEEYGAKDIAQPAVDLLLTIVSEVFDSLHARNKGQIVAVVLFRKTHSSQLQKMLDLTVDSRPSSRLLEEVKTSSNSTIVLEVALVRITLAWITGIVLLIATIIGVYLLLNMPLTRDTLLYSNVKLD